MPTLEGASSESDADDELSSDFGERDEVGSLPDFSDEETKTQFTNYSMSSSVIRRNQGLTVLDDKFEQV